MTSNRLKNLARLRLILSVIAVLLASLMVFSGVMYIGGNKPALPEEDPTETVTEPTEILADEPSEVTDAAETESPEATTEPEAPTSGTEESLDAETERKPDLFGNNPFGDSDSDTETDTDEKADTPVTEGDSTGDTNSPDTNPDATTQSLSESYSSEVTLVTTATGAQVDTASSEPAADSPEAESLNVEMNINTSRDKDPHTLLAILFWSSGALLIVDIVAIVIISGQIKQERRRLQRIRNSLSQTDEHARRTPGRSPSGTAVQPVEATQLQDHGFQIGTLHQVGRRDYQQDSLGHASVLDTKGVLAVLADGMGGLSCGEKVSQKIVMDALEMGRQLKPEQVNGVLWKMVDKINGNVNQMLGPDGLYKSGSTLLAVLAYNGKFQWIAVGDSRIYLYRQGYANQLNQDHDQLQVWMADVLSGRRSMEEVLRNPEGKKLTSFIGMGQLKYIDGSRGAIALESGDRLVLMSDGVYNVVNETSLAGILKRYPDVDQAASVIDHMIREANHPHQDNYTAIVLGF